MTLKILRYDVPIEIRALKTANVYVVDDNRKILVDTGMSDNSYRSLVSQGVKLQDIDIVYITHLHIDHIGNARRIQNEFSIPLAMGEGDVARVNAIQSDPQAFNRHTMNMMRSNGTPSGIVEEIVSHHSVLDHLGTYRDLKIDIALKGGENISTGTTAISNPGHSPGSFSLYAGKINSLISGDHVLPGITPNISPYDETTDMLGLYLESLNSTSKINAGTVYPGHRSPFENANHRIAQIIEHHNQRMKEISEILKDWKSAYTVATLMTWSKNREFGTMNYMEMNFAIGEAISHLMHMEIVGTVEQRENDGIIEYRATA